MEKAEISEKLRALASPRSDHDFDKKLRKTLGGGDLAEAICLFLFKTETVFLIGRLCNFQGHSVYVTCDGLKKAAGLRHHTLITNKSFKEEALRIEDASLEEVLLGLANYYSDLNLFFEMLAQHIEIES